MTPVQWARWTGWAGSPELLAHIARTADSALREGRAVDVGGPPESRSARTRITVSVANDAEVFDSPTSFVEKITPEALSRCEKIEMLVCSDEITTVVVFSFGAGRQAEVRLSVSAESPAPTSDEVATVASVISIAVQRGYRRYLGRVEFSSGLCEAVAGRRAPAAGVLGVGTPIALGVPTGLAVALLLTTFLPNASLPRFTKSTLAISMGAAYPLWLTYAVPDVELAVDGQTRLYRAVTRSLAALATLLLTTALRSAIGE